MLIAENIDVIYRRRNELIHGLKEASLRIEKGEMVVVTGPSGSGKTTLLMTLGGLLRPDSGKVVFDGSDVYQFSAGQMALFRNRHIGFIFQQFHLIPYLTVLENIMVPSLAGGSHLITADPKELGRRFGLEHRLEHLPSQLSTGECQRVALARALFNNPGIVLADEPTGNLDEDNGRIVIEHLKSIAADGRCVLVVTHDTRLRAEASRSLTVIQGKLSGESAH